MRILAMVFFFVLVPFAAHALDVDHCGQIVPDGETGDLVGDLTCTAGQDGIALGDQATLRFAGHVLSGSGGSTAVVCTTNRCTVLGPGEIVGGEWNGIVGNGAKGGRAILQGLRIHGTTAAISGFAKGRLTVADVRTGLTAMGRAELTDFTAHDNGNYGAHASSTLVGTNVVTIDNGGDGLSAGKLKLSGLTATGNATTGINATHAVVRDGTLTGNGVDVYTVYRPRLVDSTCGTSQQAGTSNTWSVCTSD